MNAGFAMLKYKERKLGYGSFHDPLTGVYNRAYFRAYFEHERQQMKMSAPFPMGIIIADIDGLKVVNDTFGYDEGDRLLQITAGILQKIMVGNGIVARIGSNEFAMLFTNVDQTYMEQADSNLSLAVKEYNSHCPLVPLSISSGIAVSKQGEKGIAELFKIADNNMRRVKTSHDQSTRSNVVHALLGTLRARNLETEDHSERIRDLALGLGEKVGMSQCELAELGLLAQFHDLGKVGISDKVLLKPTALNEAEWQEMKRHPEIGCRIAQSVPELLPIANLILLHHEHWDGKGYPLGLAREEIPLECRILTIVDAYDAMTNERPYRKAMARSMAMEELVRCAGRQFEHRLVVQFMDMMQSRA